MNGNLTKVPLQVTASPIVVGVVDDGRSDHAVRVAWDLSRLFNVPLDLVHAAPPGAVEAATEAAGDGEPLPDPALVAHIDGLVKTAGHSPPSWVLHSRAGLPSVLLVERARAVGAGLIVLGPHRTRGRLDLGSTLHAVLSHAPCAVWCQPVAPRPIARLVVPIDFSKDSLGALDQALDLARLLGASVRLVSAFIGPDFAYPTPTGAGGPTYVVDHVRDGHRAELKELAADYPWEGISHDQHFVEGEPAQVILDAQEEGDLVVMASHGRGAVTAALLGSVALGVLHKSDGPVLVIRHPERRAG